MNPDTFEPGPLAEVDCVAAEAGWTLVFVRELRHPVEKVWAALTEPGQLRMWAPFVADRNLASTGEVRLVMVDADVELPLAEVTRAQAPTLLEYTWGGDLLRWELEQVPEGTRLTLRHTVADRDMVSKVAAGWHLCLVVADRMLDATPIAPIRGENARDYGFDKLQDAYARQLDRDGTERGRERTD